MLAQRLFQGNLRLIVVICWDHSHLRKLINVLVLLFGCFLITASWDPHFILPLSHCSPRIACIYGVLRSDWDWFESLWGGHVSLAPLEWDGRLNSFQRTLWPKSTYFICCSHVIEVLARRDRSTLMVLSFLLRILVLIFWGDQFSMGVVLSRLFRLKWVCCHNSCWLRLSSLIEYPGSFFACVVERGGPHLVIARTRHLLVCVLVLHNLGSLVGLIELFARLSLMYFFRGPISLRCLIFLLLNEECSLIRAKFRVHINRVLRLQMLCACMLCHDAALAGLVVLPRHPLLRLPFLVLVLKVLNSTLQVSIVFPEAEDVR